jgi:sigma-B regulation protein RsbU (phosphoserine phosphatase)
MAPESKTFPKLTGLYIRNIAANLIGNLIIALLNIFTPLEFLQGWRSYLRGGGWLFISIFILAACATVIILQYLVQRPISRSLSALAHGDKIQNTIERKSARRLLNLPVILALTNLSMWFLLDLIFAPVMYSVLNMTVSSFLYNFFRVLMIGLIASFISFFLIDDFVRQKLIPIFFPAGQLAAISDAVRISILRRIRVLFGVGTNAPMILLCVTIAFAIEELDSATVTTAEFSRGILTFSGIVFIIFIIMSLSLNLLVANSILQPINEMIGLVRNVRKGGFHQKVRVVSNDELGVLGDGMNAMTEGLLERDRLRRGLYLAQEVQQSLLPSKCPIRKGLDIAARSLYCDETGGDYFDFFEDDKKQLNVVIGDVSGHGISSALLMASVRAFIRQRANLPGSLSRTLLDVNRQLAIDVEESGNFMTLFHLKIDPLEGRASWIRGGHDPAIFYNPASDRFMELDGKGQALGICEEAEFEEKERTELAPGQIIILATDGVWEARNKQGNMFGKEYLYELVRQHRKSAADDILDCCFQALEEFQNQAVREDDITMVVIKIVESETREVRINS